MSTSFHCKCGEMLQPFDIVEAWVEIHEPITELDENGFPQGYAPTGYTEEIWDTAQSIGFGCSSCGKVEITRPRIQIGGVEFMLHPASTDRFGR